MVIRISDDAGNLPAVTHTFTGTSIPSSYRWDRYMGDSSLAPKGTYTMNVRIYDKNTCTTDTASITLVVTESILSAWVSGAPTNTPIPAQPTATPLPSLTPTVENTATEVAILPATGNDTETPTSTPTTTPNPNPFVLPKAEQKTTTSTSSSPKAPDKTPDPDPTTLSTGVLIGSAAAGLIGSIAAFQLAVEAERKRKEAEARKRAEELMHLRNKLTKNGEDWHGLGMDQMKQKAAQIDAINKANEDYMYESVIASGGDPNMSVEEAVVIFTNASARKEKEAMCKKELTDAYKEVFTEAEIEEYANALSYNNISLEDINNDAKEKIVDLNTIAYANSLKNAYGNELSDEEIFDIADDIANGRETFEEINNDLFLRINGITRYDAEFFNRNIQQVQKPNEITDEINFDKLLMEFKYANYLEKEEKRKWIKEIYNGEVSDVTLQYLLSELTSGRKTPEEILKIRDAYYHDMEFFERSKTHRKIPNVLKLPFSYSSVPSYMWSSLPQEMVENIILDPEKSLTDDEILFILKTSNDLKDPLINIIKGTKTFPLILKNLGFPYISISGPKEAKNFIKLYGTRYKYSTILDDVFDIPWFKKGLFKSIEIPIIDMLITGGLNFIEFFLVENDLTFKEKVKHFSISFGVDMFLDGVINAIGAIMVFSMAAIIFALTGFFSLGLILFAIGIFSIAATIGLEYFGIPDQIKENLIGNN